MSDALIEAVARGLWNSEGYEFVFSWETSTPETQERHLVQARAALAAIEAQGFRVVPVEPTPTMYGAALEDLVPAADAHAAWSAMLSAAPRITEGGA